MTNDENKKEELTLEERFDRLMANSDCGAMSWMIAAGELMKDMLATIHSQAYHLKQTNFMKGFNDYGLEGERHD